MKKLIHFQSNSISQITHLHFHVQNSEISFASTPIFQDKRYFPAQSQVAYFRVASYDVKGFSAFGTRGIQKLPGVVIIQTNEQS